MDILFTIGGMSILVLPFVIGHLIDKKAKKPKKAKKYPETKREVLHHMRIFQALSCLSSSTLSHYSLMHITPAKLVFLFL